MSDKLKLAVAVIPIIGAIAGFYYFADQSLLLRVGGLIVAAILSLAIAYQAQPGREAFAFVRLSYIEARKVVWPTRKETVQTTLLVLLVVVIAALLLWLFDMFLGWAVRFLTG
jgi:preprotein translocase subunit SecE